MSKLTISRFWKKVPLSVGTIDNIGVVPVEISTDEENSIIMILSILVDTLNSYKEDSYAAIGRAA